MKAIINEKYGGPEEINAFLDSLEASIQARIDPETKYGFQVGLKDVAFSVNEERARDLVIDMHREMYCACALLGERLTII